MNFTREPIIETIITPREGNKLLIRSSKTDGQEEYTVDAVEVVAFGPALFFRSTEKPKSFLVPISDYEVIEVKETRVVLKNAQFERNIKIGGGRDASIRREQVEKEEEDEDDLSASIDEKSEEQEEPSRFDRKKDRRRNNRGRKRPEDEEMRARILETASGSTAAPVEPKVASNETIAPMAFTTLIPPPTTLISESINKYKEMMKPLPVEAVAPLEEPSVEEEKEKVESTESREENSMSRVVSSYEAESFIGTPTNFTSLSDWTNFLS